jgi:hypothetical protein
MSFLSSTSRFRLVVDLLWCLGFAVALTLILLRPSGAFAPDRGASLDLRQGSQIQALFRTSGGEKRRIGTVRTRVERTGKTWSVSHAFLIGGVQAGLVRTWLRADLSLARLSIRADISRLGRLSGFSGFVLRHLKDLDEIQVHGVCELETGTCEVVGRVGKHPVDLNVTAGRGPVVTSAIYPLLAQGTLGRTAEVTIFDPLALRQRLVTFHVEGRETLRLESGTFEALRVKRDLEGMNTRVWIDRQGRVLKEELPLGLTVEHASWGPAEAQR